MIKITSVLPEHESFSPLIGVVIGLGRKVFSMRSALDGEFGAYVGMFVALDIVTVIVLALVIVGEYKAKRNSEASGRAELETG